MQRLKGLLAGIGSAVWSLVSSTFAPLLLLVGAGLSYTVLPALAQVVSGTTAVPEGIAWPLLGLLVAGGILLGFELVFLTDSASPKTALQMNFVIDYVTALVLTGIGVALLWTVQLPWWYLPGWLFAVLNGASSGWFAMNTLFSKNPTQMQRGE